QTTYEADSETDADADNTSETDRVKQRVEQTDHEREQHAEDGGDDHRFDKRAEGIATLQPRGLLDRPGNERRPAATKGAVVHEHLEVHMSRSAPVRGNQRPPAARLAARRAGRIGLRRLVTINRRTGSSC